MRSRRPEARRWLRRAAALLVPTALVLAAWAAANGAPAAKPGTPSDDPPPKREATTGGGRRGGLPWPLPLGLFALAALLVGGGITWRSLTQLHQQDALARALTGGDPSRAPELVTRYGCGGCHTIPGVPGADGRVAAPLQNLRERVYVGGVARNTAPNLISWIVDPAAFSPRTAMPRTGITEPEARDVAAYLYAH